MNQLEFLKEALKCWNDNGMPCCMFKKQQNPIV